MNFLKIIKKNYLKKWIKKELQKIFFLISIMFFSLGNSQFEKRSVYVKKINQKIIVDGILNEKIWLEANAADDFWQLLPTDSLKSINKTEVKLLYDDTHLYIGIVAYSVGDNYTINSLRRDFSSYNNDCITICFDTFNDGQNGYVFGTNAYGVQREGLLFNRGNDTRSYNLNWDTKWQSASQTHEKKYVLEFAIPFSSIKYAENSKSWGFQAYRADFQVIERSIWTNVDQTQLPVNIGYFGEMIFEEPLKKNNTPLYLIPYVNSLRSREFGSTDKVNSFTAGGDLKIAIGTGLNLDATLNPDFSNVEVDDVITNLSRFEITLPEKRQFFIDNGDLFGSFGSFRNAIPFFSRRIGLQRNSEGTTIQNKITGGVRLSGKLDENWRLGFLSIQNSEDHINKITSNNNTMIALQRKVLGESQVGIFMVNRQTFREYDFLEENDKFNRVLGLDYNLASSNNKWIGKFYTHKSFEPDDNIGNFSGFASLNYNTRVWQISTNTAFIDEDFRADLGFIRRTGILKSGNKVVYNFYPKSNKVNSHSFELSNYLWFQQNLNYKKTDQTSQITYSLRTKSQSQLELEFNSKYIYLFNSFDPTRSDGSVPLPTNSEYNFNDYSLRFRLNSSTPIIFNSKVVYGGFFNGSRFSFSGTAGYRFQPKFILSFQWDFNSIQLPDPYPKANLVIFRPKLDLTFTKKLFWSTLIQYSNQTNNLGINSRLQWRFAPLSDLYLVYNDNYYTQEFRPIFRSINLKISYWLNL